jgi:uncharacterized protein Usg
MFMIRKFISVITGAILFITLIGIVMMIFGVELTKGRLAKTMPDDKAFDLMLRHFYFIKFFIFPLMAIVAGFLTGWISKTKGWLCSLIAIGTVSIIMDMASLISSIVSIIICILLAAISGHVANMLFSVKKLNANGSVL